MDTPWAPAWMFNTGNRWWDTPKIHWWDRTTEQAAHLASWWDGAAEQPVRIEGWWDGTTLQPLSM